MAGRGRGLGRWILFVPLQTLRQSVQATYHNKFRLSVQPGIQRGGFFYFTLILSSNKGQVVTSGTILQPDLLAS